MSKLLSAALAVILALGVSACGNQGAKSSAQATPDNPMILALAHNMSETHTVHMAISQFADEVKERTGGRIQIKIFANGQLGNEVEEMEQVMAGVIAMTKVSAPGLATYDDAYHTFGLPYIFEDTADFYHVMDSDPMYEFFKTSYDKGFVTLTYYTSGARSFYTVNRPIRTPADLKGLKIRVQDMKSQTEMVSVMGGTPVAMAYGDVFTSLQTGIIDGTENNETALTLGKHGEVCKVYSTDQHAMIPDVLLISSKVWDTLSKEDQAVLVAAARNSTIEHQKMWDQSVADAIKEASTKMGVTFVNDVDKDAFRQATSGMVSKYSKEYEGVARLLALINKIRAQEKADAAQNSAAAVQSLDTSNLQTQANSNLQAQATSNLQAQVSPNLQTQALSTSQSAQEL